MSSDGSSTERRFFSLQWKAALLIVFVLIAVNLLVQTASYRRQQEARAAEWSAHLAHVQQAFIATTERSALQLKRMAAEFADEADQVGTPRAPRVIAADQFAGIDSVRFFDRDGRVLYAWQAEAGRAPPAGLVSETLRSIRLDDQPRTYLQCGNGCWQHAFLPVMTPQGREVVIALSRSAADLVGDFQSVTQADIALLADPPEGGKRAVWGYDVALATHPETVQPWLRLLSRQKRMEDLRHGQLVRLGRDWLAISVFDLPISSTYRRTTAVLLENETGRVEASRVGLLADLTISSLGVLLVGGTLALALMYPMRRLRRLSLALPKLAENRFGDVRAEVGTRTAPKAGAADEIDVLQRVSLELTNRLETLSEQVERRTESLRSKVQELDRERQFIERLLDTAPVVIVLHDGSTILRMNKHGHTLTGWPEAKITGKRVGEVIELAAGEPDVFTELRMKGSAPQQLETGLICANGERRQVVWLHSNVQTEQGLMVMSVGLDMTRQRETEYRLRWLATHDAVTDLLNREGFQLELRDGLERLRGQSRTATLVVIDLDHFQEINETYSHQGGDYALKVTAEKLKQLAGAGALIGRLGSDEFAIFQPAWDAASAQAMAEALCSGLALTQLQFENHKPVHLSATGGFVIYPDHGDSPAELMANANLAVVQAKRLTLGHAHALTLDLSVRAARRERLAMRDEISTALVEDRFLLHYQPILDMKTCRISHCEALVRMQDRDGRVHPPSAFIQIAEESGQITAISHTVLRKVIETQAALRQAGHSLKFSINLAAKAFEDPALVDIVKRLLVQNGTDGRYFVFEVVESEAIANMETARTVTAELTALGAAFAFDDFGVGFTSFEYLRVLPVEYVKIDQSFILHLHEKETDRLLVHTMNDMIQRLNLKSVAEGVENARALDILREIGVDYCQGYHISYPLPYPPVGREAEAIEREIQAEMSRKAANVA